MFTLASNQLYRDIGSIGMSLKRFIVIKYLKVYAELLYFHWDMKTKLKAELLAFGYIVYGISRGP